MRFSTVAIFGALVAIASAQNPFTRTSYDGISAGQPEDITWEPTTKGTVTIVLMQGDPKALTPVQTVATGIVNDGKYSWTPDPTLVQGDDYALKIVDDLDPNASPNYTTLFSIESDVTESASSSAASTASTVITTVASSTKTETTDSESSSASGTESSSASNTETTTTGTESSTSASETSTMESSTRRTSTRASSSAAPTSTTVVAGAAPTGAKIGAGLIGFVGAAVLLL